MTTSRSSEQGRANRAPPPVDPLTARLVSWSEGNASLMALAVAGGWLAGSLRWTVAAAAGSFLALIVGFRRRWTPLGRFGAANLITALRLLGALALLLGASRGAWWPALVALVILCADGLDGWVARRLGLASTFGQVFEQEVDAFFLLALCLVPYVEGQLGAWVLFPGTLRYLFVLFAKVAKPPRSTAPGNGFTRAVAVLAILALIACLLPVERVCPGAAWAATVALSASFLYSTWRLYRPAA
ncbi:CDP-alcohol phosphatidyltransferase family protein [Candidatus Methylocalor cossyra]|uniref:CDP-alcohol phosphatidyltransferase family protein n=1 Tax=Candidatus Methylocalor cossyra TaxID=3108543 RepID=UPI0032B0F523